MIKVLKVNEEVMFKCLEKGKELKHSSYSFSIQIKLKSSDKFCIVIKTANKIIKKEHIYIEYPFIEDCAGILLYNNKTSDIELIDDDLFLLIKNIIKYEDMSIDDFEVVGSNNDCRDSKRI